MPWVRSMVAVVYPSAVAHIEGGRSYELITLRKKGDVYEMIVSSGILGFDFIMSIEYAETEKEVEGVRILEPIKYKAYVPLHNIEITAESIEALEKRLESERRGKDPVDIYDIFAKVEKGVVAFIVRNYNSGEKFIVTINIESNKIATLKMPDGLEADKILGVEDNVLSLKQTNRLLLVDMNNGEIEEYKGLYLKANRRIKVLVDERRIVNIYRDDKLVYRTPYYIPEEEKKCIEELKRDPPIFNNGLPTYVHCESDDRCIASVCAPGPEKCYDYEYNPRELCSEKFEGVAILDGKVITVGYTTIKVIDIQNGEEQIIPTGLNIRSLRGNREPITANRDMIVIETPQSSGKVILIDKNGNIEKKMLSLPQLTRDCYNVYEPMTVSINSRTVVRVRRNCKNEYYVLLYEF